MLSVCRHCAALVSRRWARCVSAPELCRHVAMSWPNDPLCPLGFTGAIASLAAFMLRHGPHVRSLSISASGSAPERESSSAEGQAQLACCLAACAGGQLESLCVYVPCVVVAAWAPALRTLRQLYLGCLSESGELFISSSLHGLTQLTRLVLESTRVNFVSGAHLPPSIEQLGFDERSNGTLPEQVRFIVAGSHGRALVADETPSGRLAMIIHNL